MSYHGPLYKGRQNLPTPSEFTMLTLGEVVDTNDPQQMGRVRVACPLLGDKEGTPVENIPWATYISPLGGTTTSPARGRGDVQTPGEIAYGMFNIPKVGSTAMVACIDGCPKFRVWMGCLHDQFLTHTMPHGRYSYATDEQPDGPFSSSEDPIQPLYDSQTQAFTRAGAPSPRTSYEFRTRASDVSVSGLGEGFINVPVSIVSLLDDDVDVKYTEADGTKHTNTQGYPESRVELGEVTENTADVLRDPQTYSWTTPGFHSLSMTDSAENCRIRFRTTHGHQVIMDDTNERIYISTAGGKTWIEMDEVGNIDIFGERNVSVHAKKDINFTAGEGFRVNAKNIQLNATEAVKIHATTDINILSPADVFVGGNTIHLNSTTNSFITAGGILNLSASGNILNTGAEVHLNGPPATSASAASAADPTASRVPEHEPWARTMTDPTTGEPEFGYDDPNVGRKEGNDDFDRNDNWHR